MKKKHIERLLISIPLGVIAISLIIIIIKGHLNNNDIDFDKLGGWGGFIGGLVGTYLTLIATLYVYKTFHYQKKELKSQKKELSIQKELIAQQQFENTFFNLLNTHRELKRDLSFDSKKSLTHLLSSSNIILNPNYTNIKGQEVFLLANKDFYKLLNQSDLATHLILIRHNPLSYNIDKKLTDELFNFSQKSMAWKEIEKIINAYNFIFEIYKNQISHYCRNVYHILKFIKKNENQENKGEDSKKKFRQYADIFQSQLTVEEQKLLFYNCVVFNDPEKHDKEFTTLNLINYYEFLENIGIENLVKKEHKNLYQFTIKGTD